MAPRTGRGKVRGNGDGALYYSQARDRWIGIASIPDPAAKDGRRRIKVSGKDKATAKRKLDEALGKIKQGVPVGPARETVAEALRYWLERGLNRNKIKSRPRSTISPGRSRSRSSPRSAPAACVTSNASTSRTCSPTWQKPA